MLIRDVAAALLILLGAFVVFSAALGVVRFPDAYMRMHAATKAGVVGSGSIMLGAGLATGSWPTFLIALLGVFFLLATVSLSAHALGRAAYLSGAPLAPETTHDALHGLYPRHDFDQVDGAAPTQTLPVSPEPPPPAP